MSARRGARRASLGAGAAVVILSCYVLAASVAAVVPLLLGAGRAATAGVLAAAAGGIFTWAAAPRLAGPPSALPAPPVRPSPETERLTRHLALERQFDRALESTGDDGEVHGVVGRALAAGDPGTRAELLMSRDHRLVQVIETGPDGEGPGCPVARPGDCPAMTRDRTLRWGSSDDLDACPHLRDREAQPLAAVCVPVRVGGRVRGVLHRCDPADAPPSALDVDYLERVAAGAGARYTLLAAGPAATTPIGLTPRRSVERQVRGLLQTRTGFVLARCDVHRADEPGRPPGSELGEVARLARGLLRPGDTVGHGGGNRLLIVFVETSDDAARRALGRLGEQLVLETAGRRLPALRLDTALVAVDAPAEVDELLDRLDRLDEGPGTGGPSDPGPQPRPNPSP